MRRAIERTISVALLFVAHCGNASGSAGGPTTGTTSGSGAAGSGQAGQTTGVGGSGASAGAAGAAGSGGTGASSGTAGAGAAGNAGTSGESTGTSGAGGSSAGATAGTTAGTTTGGATGSASGHDAGATSGSTSGATGAPDGGAMHDASGASGSTSGSGDAGALSNPAYILGADISSVQQAIAGGAQYYDDDGTQKDILALLKGHGFNYIRLRTFVDPTQSAPNPMGGTFAPYSTQGYGDITHVVAYAKLVKAAGLGFLLDFHYSDYWADPGKQIKPAAWAAEDLTSFTTALSSYTQDAITQLVAAGARPDIVQVGNEITPGMDLTPGTALGPTSNWKQLAQLLTAGIDAIHGVDPTIQIMLHIDRGGDLATSTTWITNAMSNGVKFDVFGESCYVAYQGQPSGWQNTFTQLAAKFPNLKFVMAEYNEDTSDNTEVRQANDIIFNLPNHQGLGTFFWEPTESGAWGPGLFTSSGNKVSTIPASIDQYDQMKTAYGL
jgi:arabinogalactan endo-1,4-beta-galactosidase